MNPALELYYKEIEATNRRIGKHKNWDDYAKKFKKVNPELFGALAKVELRIVKNEYLKNWIKNLRS
jgi:hypothetical protein